MSCDLFSLTDIQSMQTITVCFLHLGILINSTYDVSALTVKFSSI